MLKGENDRMCGRNWDTRLVREVRTIEGTCARTVSTRDRSAWDIMVIAN